MVTTRSADKRLDTSRAEDLVLRSRTIESPNSTASTPSQSQKRTASARENINGLRSKRLRTDPAGNAANKSSHVVVNIPVKSIHHDNDSAPDNSTTETDQKTEVKTTRDNDLTTDDDSGQVTPKTKITTLAETPDQGSQTFKTPATSRHKRFDSEEPDDDTILVGAAIDSSAPQGYQTAEEEIADSDDDDAAPEIESTKVAPRLPQRKSARTPRVKKQSETALSNVGLNDETVEVVPSQTETESVTIGKESSISVSDHGFDEVAEVQKPEQGGLRDTGLVSSAPGSAHFQTTTSSQPLTYTTTSAPSNIPSGELAPANQKEARPLPSNQELLDSRDIDTESVTVSDSTLQDLSLTERNASSRVRVVPNEISRTTSDIPSSRALVKSAKTQLRASESTPGPSSVRLPARATSGVSDYRRRKFQQKVAGSAGGFKMQTDWSKKRSSFVVS